MIRLHRCGKSASRHYATLMLGIRHPQLARSLVVAGCGSGALESHRAAFKAHAEAMAVQFLTEGAPSVATALGLSATRIQLQNKDPRGWEEFVRHLCDHSSQGSAFTLRKYQIEKPSLYDLESQLRGISIPVLLAVGDEDDSCLDTNLFLKRTIPTSGLWVLPKSGHAINLEEPAAFNAAVIGFLSTVERGRWEARDTRSLAEGIANPVRMKAWS